MSDFGSLAPGGEAPVRTRYAIGASGYGAESCIGEYITPCRPALVARAGGHWKGDFGSSQRSVLKLRVVTTSDEGTYETLSRLGELGREIERHRGPDPYPRPTGPAPSLEALRRRRDEIMRIAARHGARTVSVFGSVARGDARPHSDVDLLVDTGGPQSVFAQAALQSDLEDLLGCPCTFAHQSRIELCP